MTYARSACSTIGDLHTEFENGMAKITFVISGLSGGGAERVCCNLANRLSREGHQCHVVTLAMITDSDYVLDAQVTRTALGLLGKSASVTRSLLSLIHRVKAIRQVLLNDPCDTVVSFMDRTNVLTLMASQGLNVRVIVSERNFPPALPPGRFWGVLRYLLYRSADTVVVQTQKGAQWIRHHTLARHVVSIPNWIDWPLTSSQPCVPVPGTLSGRVVLLAVGRDAPQKGFERLLRCYRDVAAVKPETRLVIIGPKTDTPLRALTERLGIEGNVLFPGAMGNVADWYQHSDVFALSSHFEGFPNVLLEAMAASCACVAFDIDTGPRDIIEHGFNGYLIADGEEKQFAHQLMRLIDDAVLRRRIGANATQVTSRFSVERVYRQWLAEILPGQVLLPSQVQ